MRIVFYWILLFMLFFNQAYSQEIVTETYREDLRSVMLEFIDVKNQEVIAELDSIKESSSSTTPIAQDDIEIFKRMKMVSKTIPLEYNEQVKFYIDKYSSTNYRPYMNRLMGLSKHYFSIYEKALVESGIPEEVKYLSLVESSLNPHLISSSGAVGPWQFMYVAAKEYHLEMNKYIDERKDAYSSSYAVAAYINDAYKMFDDWLLALASYNCGRGCVQRAIIRSGLEKPSFWELSPFLPQQTRNYIPKFIAMTYVLSESDFYSISPIDTELDLAHKVVLVDKSVSIEHVANAIGMSKEKLKNYNPAFKGDFINGTVDKPKRLLLPLTDVTNDSLLYVALNTTNVLDNSTKIASTNGRYKVKGGETLDVVGRKFGITVQNLRAWNGLNSRSSIVGKTLIVEKPIDDKLVNRVNTIASSKKKSNVIIYTVKSGDSLDRIANKYPGVSVSTLKADNNLKSNLIKPGMKLEIKKGKV